MSARVALALTCALLAGCANTQSPENAPPSTAPALEQRLADLEARAERIEDINAIKRLQRAYGYYLDEGRWDDAADLFADEASLEIGFDGVYRGRARIREYLRALGDGRQGLKPGQLNEHLQLMPVITMLPGGQQARGTWRAVILAGQLGRDAYWAEGPYENLYVKHDGVWKIAGLHWFQTLWVPYAGGWEKNSDVNAGRFVGDRLKADAPPSQQYKTWPGAFTPPFHFRGQYPGLSPLSPATSSGKASLSELSRRQAALAERARRLADQDTIENLQRIYGFYVDKGLWSEASSLFTDDAQFEIQGRGIFRGKDHILAYLRAIGPEGLQAGRLYDQMQLQPLTHVAADGKTARGRWHLFAQLAQHGQFHEWETGVYENEYRNEGGVWKISRLHLYPTMITPYEAGWGKQSLPASRFEPALKPDVPSPTASTYDHAFTPPYHYAHPVRGARAMPVVARARALDERQLASSIGDLERQLGRTEDRASIENLQTAYGYYLATLLWDDLADLFAEDGTIEIALRGIYAGRPAVRRNLNLYGQAGLDDGVLHNHMQYQMVIDVMPDGATARLRSRALSMMGNFGKSSMWMGGTYENEFVKINGRWMFHKDQQINTYFAPYETGWKDLPQRAPPGITASNPPDRPPSFAFDLYPKNFLPPFHYVNPVTGKAYSP
jgi:SnoaL-like domain